MAKNPKKPKSNHNPEGAPEFVREVPIELNAAEKEKIGKELANLEVEVEVSKMQLAEHCAAERSVIRDKRARISVLAKVIQKGEEERPTRCFERKVFAQNVVEVVRADNGAVVDRRAMTTEDRQEQFPLVPTKGKRGAGRKKADASGGNGALLHLPTVSANSVADDGEHAEA